jgi:hypothetical protein
MAVGCDWNRRLAVKEKEFPVKILWVVLLLVSSAFAQSPVKSDPWKALSFLEGTWVATAQGSGDVSSSGRYTFRRELDGTILARHSTSDPGCKGPAEFDCKHGDLLYLYAEGGGIKAIYFDNEGHVIHYDVSTPEATTAVFLSEARPGPRFRLTYVLKGGVMSGRFEMQMPGQTEWKLYLEWSGGKG